MSTCATVRHLLQVKGDDVWSVSPESTVYDALHLMAEKNIGAVLVMEKNNIVGVFSERDYARRVILEGKSSRSMPVRDVMSRSIVFVTPEESVVTCLKLMILKKVRHLPVIEKKEVVGIVTIGDVGKKIISDQEFTIQELEKYITGGR